MRLHYYWGRHLQRRQETKWTTWVVQGVLVVELLDVKHVDDPVIWNRLAASLQRYAILQATSLLQR